MCKYLRELNIPVLLDCKLGDIGTTTEYYKKFVFDELKADSCTLNTFLGSDVLKSFCSDSSGNFVNDLFILAKCSNESSKEFQSALLKDGTPLYLRVIHQSEKFLGLKHFINYHLIIYYQLSGYWLLTITVNIRLIIG